MTFSKSLKEETGLPISPYIGASFGTFDNTLRPIGGIAIRLHEKFSTLHMFDGVHIHHSFNWHFTRHSTLSFLLINHNDPGFSISFRF